jgi:hypothetical protein
VLAVGGVRAIPLPARSPNLNAFAERWVRSVKQECLSRLILFGERPLSRLWPNSALIITARETIKGKATDCFSPSRAMNPNSAAAPLSIATASEVY